MMVLDEKLPKGLQFILRETWMSEANLLVDQLTSNVHD